MAHKNFQKLCLGVCLVTAALFIALRVANAQTLESHPEFDVGDKWTYRFQNTGDRKEPYLYTNQVYKSKDGSGWLYGETQEINPRRAQYVWRYDYKRADNMEGFEFDPLVPSKHGKRFSNRQPLDNKIQFPLSVGKKYSVKLDWTDGNGYTKYDVEVEEFEKVTTQAGVFDAYRIKLSGWWNRTRDGNFSGRSEQTVFYAPEVKRLVKSDFFDRNTSGSVFNSEKLELIKWEPKAALPIALTTSAVQPSVPVSAAR